MTVADTDFSECGRKCIARELRVAAGSRVAAHVYDLGDAVGREQAQELAELAGRVSDCVDHVEGKKATVGLAATRAIGQLEGRYR